MELIIHYVLLFAIIIIIGYLFDKSIFPLSLILVISGMILSLIPDFPEFTLNPSIVLNILLPLMIYQISAFTAWRDVKKNLRPITLMSIGHVIFITILVAVVIHTLIPSFGWGLSFVLGAVISPPDDVAIVSIAEKIHLPSRLLTILEGEGLLNDATALIIFRFALAAVVTSQFYFWEATGEFFAVIGGETLYGLAVGFILGKLRLKIRNPMLGIMASLITPFIAYIPPVLLGGSGIIATVVTGFIIGNWFALKVSPAFRLFSRSIWPPITFVIQSAIFFIIGLHMKGILERISSIPESSLWIYSISVIATVIIGRFAWVFLVVYFLPRFLSTAVRKKDPCPPWQFPFVISWAGMRGGISLTAAVAVPLLPTSADGVNPRDLLIFLVFCVIVATLILQGITLPWLLKKLGLKKYGQHEKYNEHIIELKTKLKMINAALRWLKEYNALESDNPNLSAQIKLHIREYRMLKKQMKERIAGHSDEMDHDEKAEREEETFLLAQIIEVERGKLLEMWRTDKITVSVRDRLLENLDHQTKNLQ